MKRIIYLLTFLLFTQPSLIAADKGNNLQPKLVVGIVVDQMRFDYLYRFYDQYSDNGFKRLMNQGMNFTYAQYNYIPTYTGPGHASIYTGTTPYYHGIISNDWYDKKSKKVINCISDTTCKTVGAENTEGQVSPKQLLASTITDQLRMSNNGLSRVFAVSVKDRAAVLPGGHMANAVYWYDGLTGNFISSSYYMKELPGWVKNFNMLQLPQKFMKTSWQLLKEQDYTSSMPDNGLGERDLFNEKETTFPHIFDSISVKQRLESIKSTPFGNELLTDFVFRLIFNEKLGQTDYPDFLAVSFSSTDYIGHAYGPNSLEVMDTYVKLDLQIAKLLDSLDRRVGKGNYLLFLTADHGVKPNRAYLEDNHFQAGSVNTKTVGVQLREFCKHRFRTPRIIEILSDNQVYYNHWVLDSLNLDNHSVNTALINFLRTTYPQIGTISTKEDLNSKIPTRSMETFFLNGSSPYRSGDLSFELSIDYLTGDESLETGTSHQSSYDYDTHVPLLFFGWHIVPGESNEEVYIEDIAPTIANLIHIQEPDATIGVPIVKEKP
ncbi:MAG: alkaline phosphatase family protein [Bacteroidetes bacterium]|nr:alkaline phosphatase family protein [Bacteroidota bacterium]